MIGLDYRCLDCAVLEAESVVSTGSVDLSTSVRNKTLAAAELRLGPEQQVPSACSVKGHHQTFCLRVTFMWLL